MKELNITVQDISGIESKLRPVTGGVPIAEGAAPKDSKFQLKDENGNMVPLQAEVIAKWKDGSARWILLDFQSDPPKNNKAKYTLSWTNDEAIKNKEMGDKKSLEYDSIKVSPSDKSLLNVSDRLEVDLLITDEDGQKYDAVTESYHIETSDILKSTLLLVGSFRNSAEERLFQFRLRASVYSGLSMIRLEPLILVDADKGVIQKIRELKLSIKPLDGVKTGKIAGNPDWKGEVKKEIRLFQYDDMNYRLENAGGTGGKGPGWAEFNDGKGNMAIAIRDFWQQWPKSLEISPERISVGIFPRFHDGNYAHVEPWYKYQYLFEGNCYKLRTGQARRWDIWLEMAGDGDSLAKMANAPLIPVVDPAQAVATGVWDDIAPAGIPEMADYDPWAENLFDNYCESIEFQKDYGAMNWGDWFGERQVNWGNHEYDTTNQILIQFARTGDPKYFYVADTAARHSSEVDTVHFVNDDLSEHFGKSSTYPARPGMVHQHTVGHVSGFYDTETIRNLFIEKKVDGPNPYLCLDPRNLGHIWTQGLVRHYFLTGDPFVKETVEKIGDNLAKLAEDRQYKFMGHTHCGRTTGWSLLAMAGAYELEFGDRHLNAMRLLVGDAIDEQDSNCGGWLYSLPGDHCRCQKMKHVGMAGFITAVLINGLSRYYLLTGDERLPEVIDRAVTFLDNDTWHEEWKDWRYTSCPATRATGQPGVVVMAHLNGSRITKNPEHLRVLKIAWDAKFQRLLKLPKPRPGHGKGYSSTMYGCAEAIGLLASNKGE